MQACRADRDAGLGGHWLALLGFGLFVGGFLAGDLWVRQIPAASRFDDVPKYQLWAALVGAVVGLALASAAAYLVWLRGLLALDDGSSAGTVPTWVGVTVLVLATPLAVLFVGADTAAPSLDREVGQQTRPITVLVALCQLPGLLGFVAVRHVSREDALWAETGVCRLRLVLRLRTELRRLLTLLGALLTLLVVTTGMRRQAFAALSPDDALPAEAVLLYGLVFATLLGGFYLVAAGALDDRARSLLDEYAPLPDPAADDLTTPLGRRDALGGVVGVGGSWRTFETTVVIAAPLITALIGSALGS
jgi:hypothetical protein